MSTSEVMNNSTMQGTPMKYSGGYGAGGGLDFLAQHMTTTTNQASGSTGLRSRSNYLPGQGIVGKIGYMGAGG